MDGAQAGSSGVANAKVGGRSSARKETMLVAGGEWAIAVWRAH